MRAGWVAVLAIALACGGKKDEPKSRAPAEMKAAPAIDAAIPVDPAAATAHVKAGRTLGRDKKWREAAAELEKAVAADPTDARAWSELGWAAFQAGDLARAKTANETSVARATDDNLKAASLYNLGRIFEKQQDYDAARARYAESLALRPNATVQRRHDALTPGKADVAAALHCDEPVPRDALCACLGEHIAEDPTALVEDWDDADDDAGATATDEGATVPAACKTVGGTTGIEIWQVTYAGDTDAMHGYWAVGVDGANAFSIGMLRNNIGLMRRAYNELTLDSVKKLSAGDRQYARIVASTVEYEESFGEAQTWKAREVTLCPLPPTPGTGCPLQIDATWSVERAPMWDDDDGAKLAEMKREYGADLNRTRTLDLAVDASGKATVRLTAGTFGKYERDVTGTYVLW